MASRVQQRADENCPDAHGMGQMQSGVAPLEVFVQLFRPA